MVMARVLNNLFSRNLEADYDHQVAPVVLRILDPASNLTS
jgi:hypothetical protein